MPEYYKTQKGYCYKKTQKGGKCRITKAEYEKSMNGGMFSSSRTDTETKMRKEIKDAYDQLAYPFNLRIGQLENGLRVLEKRLRVLENEKLINK
tara:strand:- start:70 stop:351 length:282 start_codon:yes stop_codon:yes gene_type:complete